MTDSLEEIQDEILNTLHAGEPVDREAVLATHPAHREALTAFFEVVELMEAAPEREEAVPARLGEFRIIREIGRGGMGVVYEAEQPSLKRTVALKVLPPRLRADRGLHARFKREAEAAARLRHPNLVPVFSCGDSAGAPFFAMELVEGTSLEHVIRERREGGSESWPETGEASWRRAIELCTKIADALQYAHGRGILHRDVKPANILLEPDGTPRLTDFGLALDLEASSLTVAGEVFGSPQYMSPEQAFRRESPLDARTDVYSLAVTLYELITLELPYGGRTQTDVLTALSSGDLVPLCEVDSELPEALERVLSRALQHRAEERYNDAAEFASDLRVVLEGGGTGAIRARRSGRGRRWSGRRISLVVAGSLAIAALFIVIRDRIDRSGYFSDEASVADILSAADGESDQGTQFVESWLEPKIRMRGVIARNAEATCVLSIRVSIPELEEIVSIVPIWERAIDGGAWNPIHLKIPIHDLAGEGALSQSISDNLLAQLEDQSETRTLTVRHRLRARVLRRTAAMVDRQSLTVEEAEALDQGNLGEWTWPAQTLFVYDEYPADYPERIQETEHAEAMQHALTPRKVSVQAIGDRWMTIGFLYEADQAVRALPSAFDIELRDEATRELLATAELYVEKSLDNINPDYRGTMMRYFSFEMPAEPTEAEASFLLGVRSGDLESVLLNFRASRDVALGEPDLDRYWDADFEAVVPLGVDKSFK